VAPEQDGGDADVLLVADRAAERARQPGVGQLLVRAQ
jgi:hypothetical protein